MSEEEIAEIEILLEKIECDRRVCNLLATHGFVDAFFVRDKELCQELEKLCAIKNRNSLFFNYYVDDNSKIMRRNKLTRKSKLWLT